MAELTLTQRVDRGELAFVNLRSVRNAQQHALFPWASALANEALEKAEHVDEADGAVWIDAATLREIRERHRVPLAAEKRQELQEKSVELRELRAQAELSDQEEQRARALAERIKELRDEKRGYPMDRNPLAQEDLFRAWRKHSPEAAAE